MKDVIVVSGEGIGSPDRSLGHTVMGNFLRLLGEREDLPKHIVLMNGGVKLAVSGSDTLDFLKKLEERGVEIISCRTCVDFFGIEKEIAVGKIDGMVRILDLLAVHEVLTV